VSRAPALFDLHGRGALVTGGSRGIGRWIAEGLAEAGARVVIAARKRAACEQAAREIADANEGRCHAVACDVSRPDEVEALVAAAARVLPRIDVLVNNAAIVWAAPTLDYPLEGWDKVFALNVRGAFHLTRCVARHMHDDEGGGAVVNVSSLNAHFGAREQHQPVVAYNASKGALEALTRDLSAKFAPLDIRVNALVPGSFDTDMADFVKRDATRFAGYLTTIPMGRLGEGDDVKGAALFLASDASRYVTGQTLVVDGGVAARGGPHPID